VKRRTQLHSEFLQIPIYRVGKLAHWLLTALGLFLSVPALLDARHIFVNSFTVSISFSWTTTHTTPQKTHKSGKCVYLERWIRQKFESSLGCKNYVLELLLFYLYDVGCEPEIVKQWFLIQFLQSKTKQILILVCFMMAVDSSFKWWFLYPMWTWFFCTIISVQVQRRSWLKWSMIFLWVQMVPIVQYDHRFFAWSNAILTLPSKIGCEECAKASLGYCSPSVSWSLYLSNSYSLNAASALVWQAFWLEVVVYSSNQEPLKMDIQHNVQNLKSLYIGPLVARKSFLHPYHDRVQVSSLVLVWSSCIFTTAGKMFYLWSMFQAFFFLVSFLK
jgi:hypothetical protein